MKVLERNVMRLAVVQHIRAAYNIKTKNWNKNKLNSKLSTSQSVKVFGVALESLPHCPLLDYGSVPSFLVDACTHLLEHADTEGLFRKSGSIVRLKALRAKLDQGEECLSSALPVDVAALLKQFFRELPEPVLSMELHSAFLKAQELPTEEERTSATMLLSCVLPERNLNTLRYFFSFLQSVSQRSAENKMDSSNLSVIFAPNLLHFAEGAEKINAATERKLKLQAAVVHCFIQNARNFGVVPQFLQEKVPAMLGCEAGLFSPPLDHAEEHAASSGLRRSHRRSLGVFSSATPVIMTPNTKRKLPLDTGHNHESTNKKRRSIKKNLGIELLPHVLFGAGSTPGSVHSASGVSPSVVSTGRSSRLTASSARRKSKRLSYRTHQINRHESGKTGCFSPRVPKKEAARKSLRMRFSLGKGIKDTTLGSQAPGSAKGSETIGWRLATQDSTTSFQFSKEPESSPAVVLRNKHACKATKYISKSEDNLLSPQQGPEDLRTSWSGETPDGATPYLCDSFADTPMNVCLKNNYFSEPAITAAVKPSTVCSLPKTLCCATSAESLDSACSTAEESAPTRPTLLKIKKAFGESGSDLHAVVKEHSTSCGWEEAGREERSQVSEAQASVPKDSEETPRSECSGVLSPAHKCILGEQNITFGQIEIAPLSPLHIDSALFEYRGWDSKEQSRQSLDVSTCATYGSCDTLDDPDEMPNAVNCSLLVDALDIQSPVVFRLNSVGCQSTPHQAQPEVFKKPSLPQVETSGETKPQQDTVESKSEPLPTGQQVKDAQTIKVQDQIQRFNMLTLKSPQAKRIRSPLKFQRTPVRHSVRRINSLLEHSRKPGAKSELLTKPGPMLKTTSLDAGLSVAAQLQPIPVDPLQPDAVVTKVPSFSKTRPPVPPKRVSIRNPSRISALGDVTNKVPQRVKSDTPLANRSEASELPQKSAAQQLVERETTHYRGSPRNPLNGGRLLSATKPIDL